MGLTQRLLATSGMLALICGIPVSTTPSFAAQQSSAVDNTGQCLPGATEEECECENALRENTIEALQRFLQKYPEEPGGNSNACRALALAAAESFSDNDDRDHGDNSGGGPISGSPN